MLTSLSLDTTLCILSFLSVPDVVNLYLLSRDYRRFLRDNEDAIYHQIAVLLHFVPSGCSLTKAIGRAPWLQSVTSWRDFCKRAGVVLERNWSGHGTVAYGGYLWYGPDAIRSFKVDEQEQTVLAIKETHSTLTVHAIEDGRLLWQIDSVGKLDISDEFLFLWRGKTRGIEIWRRAGDAYSASTRMISPLRDPSPLAAIPSQLQQLPATGEKGTNPTKRGVYVPHGFLRPTSGLPLLSYRFRRNLAAVVDMAALHTIVLYDIEKGTLVRSFDLDAIIRNDIGAQQLAVDPVSFVLLDLDLSSEYLCVAFDWALVILPLETAVEASADRAIVYIDRALGTRLQVQQSVPRLIKTAVHSAEISPEYTILTHEDSSSVTVSCAHVSETFASSSTDLQEERDEWNPGHGWSPCFVSVRISPDGRHLIAGTTFSLLYLFPNFSSILNGDATADDVVQMLYVLEPVSKISWELHDNRILVILDSKASLIVNLDPSYHLGTSHVASPNVAFANAQAVKFHPLASDLQVTRARIWFPSTPRTMYQRLQIALRAYGSGGRLNPDFEESDEANSDGSLSLSATGTTACFLDFTDRM